MGNHIMVVDDDAAMLTLIGLILNRAGYTVHKAQTGNQALDLLADVSPDLIILDMMMPGMDGIELCKRIRSQPGTSQTPVLFLTAHSDRHAIQRGLLAGGTGYLPKPITNAVLISKVSSVLRPEAQAH